MNKLKLYYWIRDKIKWEIVIRCDRCYQGVSFCKRYNGGEYHRYLKIIHEYFKVNNLLKTDIYPDVVEKHEGGNGAYSLDGEKYIFLCPMFLQKDIKKYKNPKLRKFCIILECFIFYNLDLDSFDGKEVKRYICKLLSERYTSSSKNIDKQIDVLTTKLSLKIIKEMDFSLERYFFHE